MNEPEQDQPQAGAVQPGPLPTTVQWRAVVFPGVGPLVELAFSTPAGTAVYYLPPPMAHGLANGIDAAASEADQPGVGGAGLIVPSVDMGAVMRSLGNGKGEH